MTNPPVTEEAVERVARAIVAAIKSDCTKPDGRCYAVGDIDAMEVDGEFDPKAIARAAIAALKSPPVVSEGWMPIETAPKHSEVLVAMACESSGQHWVTAATQEDDGRWFNVSDGLLYPHRWQPLPEPPLAMSVKSEATQEGQ